MSFTVRKIDDKKRRRKGFPWKSVALNTLEFGRPLLHWYEDWKKRSTKSKKAKKRVQFMKKLLLILISVLVALFILNLLGSALFSVRILSFSQLTSMAGTPPPVDRNGFTNILLMGQGTVEHDGKDLTDSIMVASVDPLNTKSVVLLSFPRDLYFLNTEKMGKGKLNTFYRDYKGYLRYMKELSRDDSSLEALKELGAEIGRVLEMPIHGVIKVDFTAFEQAVDELGGLDIEVPYDIIDNEYPDENFGYEPFEIRKGPNHLDGKTALKYARSRSTTSDFGRSARQQQLIKAMGTKAKETGFHKKSGTIVNFMKIYANNVETTFALRELVGLLSYATDMDPNNVITMQLSDRNALYDSFIEPGGFLYTPPRNLFDGAAVLLPVSIPEFPVTWKQIRGLRKLLFESRDIYLAKPTVSILNAGAPSGHARKLATELTRFGFPVDVIANASMPKQEQSIASSSDEKTKSFFASLLNMNPSDIPTELPTDEVRELTIVIGKDYSYKSLQSYIFTE
ncbi:MAG: LCP family protein [Candidatus Peribacteraceae bacterium]|jgi:LCP family protein required for cell wall assembly|nr:LCP family protein [Candidatus Peribacteraceae bacterium]MDP7646130.1 LCP family protein [Candidatus Peribacteraceae bacterium]